MHLLKLVHKVASQKLHVFSACYCLAATRRFVWQRIVAEHMSGALLLLWSAEVVLACSP